MAQILFPGHRYGNTLVPMTEDDKTNMKYKAEKCFKVLGFTKAENVSEWTLSDSVIIEFLNL